MEQGTEDKSGGCGLNVYSVLIIIIIILLDVFVDTIGGINFFAAKMEAR